jgi:hypothetical protein
MQQSLCTPALLPIVGLQVASSLPHTHTHTLSLSPLSPLSPFSPSDASTPAVLTAVFPQVISHTYIHTYTWRHRPTDTRTHAHTHMHAHAVSLHASFAAYHWHVGSVISLSFLSLFLRSTQYSTQCTVHSTQCTSHASSYSGVCVCVCVCVCARAHSLDRPSLRQH